MAQTPGTSKNRIIIGIVSLALVAALVIGGIIYATHSKQAAASEATTNATPTPTTAPTTTSTTSEPTPAAATSYKDGTYTATGSYGSPGGTESIRVSITIQGNVVTDSSVTAGSTGGDSAEYQSLFIRGYKSQVTGKNIGSLNVGKVSGSSLTPIGFNKAVVTIKAQAKA